MKTHLNKIVVLCAVCIVVVLCSCNYRNYERSDYVGVYCYKYLRKKNKILNYLVLRQDSTYKLVYVNQADTLVNTGKWYYLPQGDVMRVRLYDWVYLGVVKDITNIDKMWFMCAFYEAPNLLGFHPDADVDFWRVDSIEAAQLGIKEDSVVWKMNGQKH